MAADFTAFSGFPQEPGDWVLTGFLDIPIVCPVKQDSGERPLTPGEAARRLGVTVETLASYADAGQIPYFRLPGGQRRYHAVDIDTIRQAKEGAA